MSDVNMLYGQRRSISNVSSDVIARGTIESVDNSDVVNFHPGEMYLLSYTAFTASTGEVYGGRVIVIQVPDGEKFGTVAVTRGSIYSPTNTGATITWDDDSTMTIGTTSGRIVKYSVRRL